MRIYNRTSPVKMAKKINKALTKFQSETLSGQVAAVRESTLLVHSTAVKLLQDNTDGTPDFRYGPKRVVVISKPGDPPNTDTGRAVKSIKFEFEKDGMIGKIGTNLKYLAALEFGTKNIEPRPWLSTAVSLVSKQVGDIFLKAIQKSIKGVK